MIDRIAFACLLIPFAAGADLAVRPFKTSGIYSLGERAGWDVDAASVQTGYRYTIRKNNLTVIGSGTLEPRQPARIEAALDEPGMIYVQIEDNDPATKDIALGAAFAPEQLRPSAPEPRDFDRFWAHKLKLLKQTPANPVLTPKESGKAGVDYALLQMDHIEGRHIHGQVAKPARKGRFPGLVLFQWASPPYPLQQSWVTERATEGWLTVNIEPHDVLPDQPQSYYDALPQELKEYSNIGREDRDRNYFLQMYLADYRAIEYLASRRLQGSRSARRFAAQSRGDGRAAGALHAAIRRMAEDSAERRRRAGAQAQTGMTAVSSTARMRLASWEREKGFVSNSTPGSSRPSCIRVLRS